MDLMYKPGWEECKQRYKAWWEHEYTDYALISLYAPDPKPMAVYPETPSDLESRWTDPEFIIKSNMYNLENTYFGGDALPVWSHGYPGWEFIPVYTGCEVVLGQDTGWVYPNMDKGDLGDFSVESINIDRSCKWYRKSCELLDLAIEQSRGKALPTIGAFGSVGDNLAAMRSSEQLLYDITDDPDRITEFELRLMKLWKEYHDERYRKIAAGSDGMTCWFPLWAPGRYYAIQNDFAYMISPEAFKRCFMPAIQMQVEYLDYMVYHVDGIGNFNHVDALLSIDKLQAIQILPGVGKPSPLHYRDLLIKVQKAGKNLHIDIPVSEVPQALDMLSAKGLHMCVYDAKRSEADSVMEYVKRHSVNRW